MRAFVLPIILAALGLAWAVPSARAAQVDDLYQATVDHRDLALLDEASADGSQRAQRLALMEAALARVLVRLAGTSQVVEDPKVRRDVIDEARTFVHRFQYLERNGRYGPRLRVYFTEAAVREALWDTGWPVWGRLRPGILVWAAYRSHGSLELASPDSHPRLFSVLRAGSRREALPLLFPLLDGRDRERLTARDLLFEDWAAIDSASERYDPDVVLILRLDPTGEGGVRAEWSLGAREGSHSFRTGGRDLAAALEAGLRRVLTRLSRRYAVYPGAGESLEAEVRGLRGLDAFARVERGLAGLAAVKSVIPMLVEGDRVRYRLSFRGRPEEASHILELLDFLSPRPEEDSGEGLRAPHLRFTYRP